MIEESSDVGSEEIEENHQEVNITIEPIVNYDDAGNACRYFRIKNSQFQGVIFTIAEIRFIPVSELEEKPEGISEDEKVPTGRVLFEDTKDFTSKQLLEDETFGTVVRDVFENVIDEILNANKEGE